MALNINSQVASWRGDYYGNMKEKQGKKVFKSYCLPMLTFVFVFTRKSGNLANWSPEAGGETMLSI